LIVLAAPAALALLAFVVWPAPGRSPAEQCAGPSVAEVHWLHVIGVVVSAMVLGLAVLASLRRGSAHRTRRWLPWEVAVIAAALAGLWWGPHLYDVLIVYLSMIPGIAAGALLLAAAVQFVRGQTRWLLGATWGDTVGLLPTLYVLAALSDSGHYCF